MTNVNELIDFNNPFYFWKADSRLSNWNPSPFVDKNGYKFANNEQYIMWRKAVLFQDTDIAEQILNINNPKKVKELGRQVKNFNQSIWDTNACDIVYEGLMLKFSQNKSHLITLLNTGNRYLVEASPYDKIWGIGLDEQTARTRYQHTWPGLNWLGKCLMRTRSDLYNTS